MIEWCFTPLSTVFQSYHGDGSHYSSLSWVSPVLGWGSEMSCPRTLPRKNPEDPVRLEPGTPGLRVEHFTTEPRRTPKVILKSGLYGKGLISNHTFLNHKFMSTSPVFRKHVIIISIFSFSHISFNPFPSEKF